MATKGTARDAKVYLEVGSRRVFICSLDFPGWCRSGKGEEDALAALDAATSRYSIVAKQAGISFPYGTGKTRFQVVQRLKGSATTDFGAPGAIPPEDADPLTKREADRTACLVEAAWAVLDQVGAHAPASLRKGPRGGGRDRDAILAHVVDAESAYARKLGIRIPPPRWDDRKAVKAMRKQIVDLIRNSTGKLEIPEKGWPPRYGARRLAWHSLDHAWEIEDRSN